MTACNKQQAENSKVPEQKITTPDATKLTLEAFKNEPWNQQEKPFFEKTKITDNTGYFSSTANARNSAAEFPIKIKFTWSGIGPRGGCTTPLGICIIIGLTPSTDDTNFITTNASISDNKLIITFPKDVNSNFGLTKDGFLPILNDIYLPSNISSSPGLSIQNPKVKAGIYKANYDSAQHRYVGVVLDLE
ncbi:MAG: hypothetical protein IRZ03_17055 [Acidobacterium ailaaui]|nr:hypothetical protein [Pseudacidobacterium ailaaui]